MHIRVKPYEAVEAGEFIDKETGEVIKWGTGFLCWAFMPDYEFPVQLKLKADDKMALNRDCTFECRIDVKKGVPRVKLTFFQDGWKDGKLNA